MVYRRPLLSLVVAAIGLTVAGLIVASLIASLPGFVGQALGAPTDPGNLGAYTYLAIGGVLIALGIAIGWRMGRARPVRAAWAVVAVTASVALSRVIGLAGEGWPTLVGIAIWLAGFAALAWLVTRERWWPAGRAGSAPGHTGSTPGHTGSTPGHTGTPARQTRWAAAPTRVVAVLAGVCLVNVAVIAAVALRFDAVQAPREYALRWFPASLTDQANTDHANTEHANTEQVNTGEGGSAAPFSSPEVAFEFADSMELLPHVLLILTAFGLSYVLAASRRHTGPTATA